MNRDLERNNPFWENQIGRIGSDVEYALALESEWLASASTFHTRPIDQRNRFMPKQ